MTREHPLLLTTSLVKATLAGAKTATRRPVTSANSLVDGEPNARLFAALVWDKRVFVDPGPSPAGNPGPYLRVYDNLGDEAIHRVYPRVRPGDALWVRETWGVGCRPDPHDGWRDGIEYRADADGDESLPLHPAPEGLDLGAHAGKGWRPSIHMPRAVARIVLPVLTVGVARPCDITDREAATEGTELARIQHARTPSRGPVVDGFLNIYEAIYGAASLTGWAWSYTWLPVGGGP